MVIVDTTVWIDYLRGIRNAHTDWVDHELPIQRIGLTDLILCEVLQGVVDEKIFEEVRELLLTLQVFDTGGRDLAIAAADNHRTLRRSGFTVRKTIDCVIATFCLLSQFQLLHRDRDYDGFEDILNLSVVHP